MQEVHNFSRRYWEQALKFLQDVTTIKSKDLKKLCYTATFDEFCDKLKNNVSKYHRPACEKMLVNASTAEICFHSYPKAKHFMIDDVKRLTMGEEGSDAIYKYMKSGEHYIIDFSINGVDAFVCFFKRYKPIEVNGREIWYTAEVVYDLPEVVSYNQDHTPNQGQLVKLLSTYTLHFTKDYSVTIELAEFNHYFFEIGKINKSNDVVNEVLIDLGVLSTEDVIGIINCVVYTYNNRAKLCKKSSELKRSCKHIKIHEAHEKSDEDHYVSLTRYQKTQTSRGEYKGGHHSSPTPHERRAHFRYLQGRGSYTKVGEDFTFVGRGNGDYVSVKSCHVGDATTDSVMVYKV